MTCITSTRRCREEGEVQRICGVQENDGPAIHLRCCRLSQAAPRADPVQEEDVQATAGRARVQRDSRSPCDSQAYHLQAEDVQATESRARIEIRAAHVACSRIVLRHCIACVRQTCSGAD